MNAKLGKDPSHWERLLNCLMMTTFVQNMEIHYQFNESHHISMCGTAAQEVQKLILTILA